MRAGCDVTVFDIRQGFADARVKFVVGDLLNKDVVSAAFKGIDVVFHCASPPHHVSDEVLIKVNVRGRQHPVIG